MTISKFIRTTLVVALWATAPYHLTAQKQALQLASDIWLPFTNEGSHGNYATDLVKVALLRSGVGMSSETLDFKELLSSLKEGNVDGSPAMWRSAEREEYLYYSMPYLHNQLVLVGPRGSTVGVESINDLEGKRIAWVESYAYGFSDSETNRIVKVPVSNDQQGLNMLLNGECDYMLVDALLVQYLYQSQEEQMSTFLVVGKDPLISRSLHLAISKSVPNAQEILDRFNKVIVDMMVDGSYNQILHLDWIKVDTDGDGTAEYVLSGNHAGTAEPTSGYSLSPKKNPGATGEGYYINGQYYSNWANVPEEYKVNPPGSGDEVSPFTFFKFNLNGNN